MLALSHRPNFIPQIDMRWPDGHNLLAPIIWMGQSCRILLCSGGDALMFSYGTEKQRMRINLQNGGVDIRGSPYCFSKSSIRCECVIVNFRLKCNSANTKKCCGNIIRSQWIYLIYVPTFVRIASSCILLYSAIGCLFWIVPWSKSKRLPIYISFFRSDWIYWMLVFSNPLLHIDIIHSSYYRHNIHISPILIMKE